MQQNEPMESDRRQRPRVEGEPIRWEEIAKRGDPSSLPFLHFFDDAANPTTPER